MSWTVIPLSLSGFDSKSLKKIVFDCSKDEQNPKSGEVSLNHYIKQYAWNNDESGVSKTFVALSEGNIVGYYTSSATLVKPELLPSSARTRKLPAYPIPAFLIGKLAVSRQGQGVGLGSFLLGHAFETANQVSQFMGLYAVRVDPSDDEIRGWYIKRGFFPLQDNSSLIVLMPTIRAALLAASKKRQALLNPESS